MAKGRATVQKKAERLQERGQWEPYKIHRFMIISSLEKPFKITKSSQFSKDGHKVLLLERFSAAIQDGAAEVGSSSAQSRVGRELDVSQQSTLAAEKASSLQGYG